MEHIAALLLVIACSDDLSRCGEMPVPTSVYETVEECEADLQPSISLYTTKHPQVFGQCVEVDPAVEEEDAELVWDVKPDGTLFALIEVPEVMVASSPQARAENHVRQH
ncbi:hypothetical protein [Mesorhizobium marinum]|uniref:Uncharacterized protein n=1 Tax=Mesorhizobium marinum TaxID=3228790 RepID=A0ABV3QYN9_9HYPH